MTRGGMSDVAFAFGGEGRLLLSGCDGGGYSGDGIFCSSRVLPQQQYTVHKTLNHLESIRSYMTDSVWRIGYRCQGCCLRCWNHAHVDGQRTELSKSQSGPVTDLWAAHSKAEAPYTYASNQVPALCGQIKRVGGDGRRKNLLAAFGGTDDHDTKVVPD